MYYLKLSIRQLMYYQITLSLVMSDLDFGLRIPGNSCFKAAALYSDYAHVFQNPQNPRFLRRHGKVVFSVFVIQAEQPICRTKNNLWYNYGL